MTELKVTLLTGRTIDQGWSKEYGKFSEEYWKSVSICEIDPDDMENLRIKENESVKITTDFGSVILKAVKSNRAPHPQIIYVPYGPWANIVVDPRTHGTGMPSLKGIPAEIQPAIKEKVLQLRDLLKEHYKKG
jgi:formylmethanofuran dehydrogenase subunit D